MPGTDLRRRKRWGAASALAVAILLTAQPAAAAGFAVGQTSVSGAGAAYAGGAAAGGDASTLFSNPAGATRLGDSELMIGGMLVLPSVHFNEQGLTLFNGTPLGGNDGGNGGFDIVVPNLYALWDYDEDLKFGVGITVPFGSLRQARRRGSSGSRRLGHAMRRPSSGSSLTASPSHPSGTPLQPLPAHLLQALL